MSDFLEEYLAVLISLPKEGLEKHSHYRGLACMGMDRQPPFGVSALLLVASCTRRG